MSDTTSRQRRRVRIFERDGNMCLVCDSKKRLTLDHVIPASKGGTDTATNLITVCYSCNQRKGSKSLGGFLAGLNVSHRERERIRERIQMALMSPLPMPEARQKAQAAE